MSFGRFIYFIAESDSPEGELEQLMPAEMYVPNQEQWLELRASKKKTNFIPSCIC